MRYIILSVWFICLGFSCEKEFDYKGDARYIIKGKVLDKNNFPVPNINVGLSIFDDRFLEAQVENSNIRSTKTDVDGNFEIILANSNFNVFVISANSAFSSNNDGVDFINERFGETFSAININNIQNYEYELQNPLILGDRSALLLDCSSNPNVGQILINFDIENIQFLGTEIVSRTVNCNNPSPISVPRNEWLIYSYRVGTIGPFDVITDSIFVDKEVVTISL